MQEKRYPGLDRDTMIQNIEFWIDHIGAGNVLSEREMRMLLADLRLALIAIKSSPLDRFELADAKSANAELTN